MIFVVQHFKDVVSTDGYKRLVDSIEDDEQANSLLEELHSELSNSSIDMNCLGLVGSVLRHNPKLIKLEKMTNTEDVDNTNSRITRNTCTIM